MQNNIQTLFSRTRPRQLVQAVTTMSAGNSAARALYTVTVSAPAALTAVPDTASAKSHWLRDEARSDEAKGFKNPWESSHDFSFPEIFKAMIQ